MSETNASPTQVVQAQYAKLRSCQPQMTVTCTQSAQQAMQAMQNVLSGSQNLGQSQNQAQIQTNSLKVSDLTWWERFIYRLEMRRVRRAYIKNQRKFRKRQRLSQVRDLAHDNFYKWYLYAQKTPNLGGAPDQNQTCDSGSSYYNAVTDPTHAYPTHTHSITSPIVSTKATNANA